MRSAAILATTVVLFAAALARAATVEVIVGQNDTDTFTPAALTITAGDTVRFRWASNTHDVVSGANCVSQSPPAFPVLVAQAGQTKDQVFAKEGQYPYFCAVANHCQMGMKGVITVKAAAPGTGGSGNATTTTPSGAGKVAAASSGAVLGAAVMLMYL